MQDGHQAHTSSDRRKKLISLRARDVHAVLTFSVPSSPMTTRTIGRVNITGTAD